MTMSKQHKLISLDRQIDHAYETLSREDLEAYRNLVAEFVHDFSSPNDQKHSSNSCFSSST